MKQVNPQEYFMKMQQFLTDIGETNDQAVPYYEKIRNALDNDSISDISDAEFKDVYAQFSDTVDKYQEMDKQLNSFAVPVKLIGMNENLKKYFKQYVAGTEKMLSSLDVSKKIVDKKSFDESDEEQGTAIEKFQVTFTKMITSAKIH